MSHPSKRQYRTSTTLLIAVAFALSAACGPSRRAKSADAKATTQAEETGVKRYPLTGRVVSVDRAIQSINIDGDAIPGFMAAMTMPYQVKNASVLDKVAPGDQIKGEIVLGNQGAYLENIVVAAKMPSPNPTK